MLGIIITHQEAAGAGPGDGALTIDLDSTICETYGPDRHGDVLELEADHRRHADVENAIRDLKYGVGLNHLPSGRFAANGAWLAVQVMSHNLARWDRAHRSGGGSGDHEDPPAARLLPGRTHHPQGPWPHPASPTGLVLGNPGSHVPWPGCVPCPPDATVGL